jgi:hypothetical protein
MASTKNAARATLLARVQTAWTGAQGAGAQGAGAQGAATSIAWPNTPFAPPPLAAGAVWLRPSILWGSTFEATTGTHGTGLNFAAGVLDLAIFSAPGGGDGDAYRLADALADAFNRLDLGASGIPSPGAFVRMGSADGPQMLGDDGTGWMQTQVQIPFTVEEAV